MRAKLRQGRLRRNTENRAVHRASTSFGDIKEDNVPGLYHGRFLWENMFGFHLAGMVGDDFFKSYAVTFDFQNMQIFLQRADCSEKLGKIKAAVRDSSEMLREQAGYSFLQPTLCATAEDRQSETAATVD